jgi:hypothetical protein
LFLSSDFQEENFLSGVTGVTNFSFCVRIIAQE